jgi:hypothetical protein
VAGDELADQLLELGDLVAEVLGVGRKAGICDLRRFVAVTENMCFPSPSWRPPKRRIFRPKYIRKTLSECDNVRKLSWRGFPYRLVGDPCPHLSPLGWEPVNLTGDCIWGADTSMAENADGLRSLGQRRQNFTMPHNVPALSAYV